MTEEVIAKLLGPIDYVNEFFVVVLFCRAAKAITLQHCDVVVITQCCRHNGQTKKARRKVEDIVQLRA